MNCELKRRKRLKLRAIKCSKAWKNWEGIEKRNERKLYKSTENQRNFSGGLGSLAGDGKMLMTEGMIKSTKCLKSKSQDDIWKPYQHSRSYKFCIVKYSPMAQSQECHNSSLWARGQQRAWGELRGWEEAGAATVVVLPLPREAKAVSLSSTAPRFLPTWTMRLSPAARWPFPAAPEVQSCVQAGVSHPHTQLGGHEGVWSVVSCSLLPLWSSFHVWKIRKWSF